VKRDGGPRGAAAHRPNRRSNATLYWRRGQTRRRGRFRCTRRMTPAALPRACHGTRLACTRRFSSLAEQIVHSRPGVLAPRPAVNVTAAARGGKQPSTATVSRARTRPPPPPRVSTTGRVTRAGRVAPGSVSLLALVRRCGTPSSVGWPSPTLTGRPLPAWQSQGPRAAAVSYSRCVTHQRKH